MSSERVRLFVALELPDGVRSELVRWRERVVGDLDGLRLIEPENLHLTLCFLGWQRVEEVGAIGAASAGVPVPSLRTLSLGEARWLPKRRPRVLSVAVDDPRGVLAALKAELATVLERGGWHEREARPFLGHVSLARVRAGARVRAAALPPPAPIGLERARVVLYRSRLQRGGAQYEVLG